MAQKYCYLKVRIFEKNCFEDNNRSRYNSEDEIKKKCYERKRNLHGNSRPRQLSRINFPDYRQIYTNSGDLGLRTLRLLTLNHLMNEKSQKECIPECGHALQTGIVKSSEERRRLSLNTFGTKIKFEFNVSKNKNRRSSAPNQFFDIDVKSASYLTQASNTKEMRINMLNKKSYSNFCRLINDFLNHQSIKRSNRRISSRSNLVASVRSSSKPKTSENFIDNRIAYSPSVINVKSNLSTNVSPSLSLSEIVLSANSVVYNGLEHPDPTNLMRHTFAASLPPPSDALGFGMKS